MEPKPAQKIVVVGVGNTIHSDDGAGVHALERLQHDPRLPDDVTFIDGGTFGIELLAYLYECTRGSELRGLPCGASVHQLGVADLLATLPLVSEIPREIVLLGMQPASTDWGTELSAPVEAALGPLVEAAVEQLLRWSQEAAPHLAGRIDTGT
jgi:hydrogenase maturation protease